MKYGLRDMNGTHYPSPKLGYQNPRFADRSKYVWTASKQQQSTQSVTQHQSVPQTTHTQTPIIQAKIDRNPNCRELNSLSVTAFDPAPVVAKNIAANLLEEKVYLIREYFTCF